MVDPKASTKTKSTIKIKKRTLAMEAAPSAIPPKPKIAAMIAITKNIAAQRNIIVEFKFH
jgi:hypothetical protein